MREGGTAGNSESIFVSQIISTQVLKSRAVRIHKVSPYVVQTVCQKKHESIVKCVPGHQNVDSSQRSCGFLSGWALIYSWLVLHNEFWRSDPPLLSSLLACLPLDKHLHNCKPPVLLICVFCTFGAPPLHTPPQKKVLSYESNHQQTQEEHLE